MAYILSKNPKVKYSASEQKLFKILVAYSGRKRDLPTIQLLSWEFYGDMSELPYHAEATVGGLIRSLQKKMAANDEPFVLERVKIPGKNVMWRLNRAKATAA